MGNRLWKLKALRGEKKVSDGKTIGGKGRLTDAIISKLTTFYDINWAKKKHWVHATLFGRCAKHRRMSERGETDSRSIGSSDKFRATAVRRNVVDHKTR
ncbi:hypothetical protein TNCV_3026471 [Trichonephila clavipes]|nr:hypothetical protein TNCV_3026471 [Trichonephila clavipes]